MAGFRLVNLLPEVHPFNDDAMIMRTLRGGSQRGGKAQNAVIDGVPPGKCEIDLTTRSSKTTSSTEKQTLGDIVRDGDYVEKVKNEIDHIGQPYNFSLVTSTLRYSPRDIEDADASDWETVSLSPTSLVDSHPTFSFTESPHTTKIVSEQYRPEPQMLPTPVPAAPLMDGTHGPKKSILKNTTATSVPASDLPSSNRPSTTAQTTRTDVTSSSNKTPPPPKKPEPTPILPSGSAYKPKGHWPGGCCNPCLCICPYFRYCSRKKDPKTGWCIGCMEENNEPCSIRHCALQWCDCLAVALFFIPHCTCIPWGCWPGPKWGPSKLLKKAVKYYETRHERRDKRKEDKDKKKAQNEERKKQVKAAKEYQKAKAKAEKEGKDPDQVPIPLGLLDKGKAPVRDVPPSSAGPSAGSGSAAGRSGGSASAARNAPARQEPLVIPRTGYGYSGATREKRAEQSSNLRRLGVPFPPPPKSTTANGSQQPAEPHNARPSSGQHEVNSTRSENVKGKGRAVDSIPPLAAYNPDFPSSSAGNTATSDAQKVEIDEQSPLSEQPTLPELKKKAFQFGALFGAGAGKHGKGQELDKGKGKELDKNEDQGQQSARTTESLQKPVPGNSSKARATPSGAGKLDKGKGKVQEKLEEQGRQLPNTTEPSRRTISVNNSKARTVPANNLKARTHPSKVPLPARVEALRKPAKKSKKYRKDSGSPPPPNAPDEVDELLETMPIEHIMKHLEARRAEKEKAALAEGQVASSGAGGASKTGPAVKWAANVDNGRGESSKSQAAQASQSGQSAEGSTSEAENEVPGSPEGPSFEFKWPASDDETGEDGRSE